MARTAAPARTARTSGAAIAVTAILGSAGVAHFAVPSFFDPLVPDWVPGSKRLATYLSGVAELAAAVYPANIQAALDGGMKDAKPPFDSALVAWLRLPFQLPMFWLAWTVARSVRADERTRGLS